MSDPANLVALLAFIVALIVFACVMVARKYTGQ